MLRAARSRDPITDRPPVRPTVVPTFDPGQIARNAEIDAQVFDDLVFATVPDVSWSHERVDLTEQLVLSHLDGVAPLSMVQLTTGMGRDELHSVMCVLRARGLVELCETLPRSGVFPTRPKPREDERLTEVPAKQ